MVLGNPPRPRRTVPRSRARSAATSPRSSTASPTTTPTRALDAPLRYVTSRIGLPLLQQPPHMMPTWFARRDRLTERAARACRASFAPQLLAHGTATPSAGSAGAILVSVGGGREERAEGARRPSEGGRSPPPSQMERRITCRSGSV